MASIHGISIKNVECFLDHEELLIHKGEIYLNGKKIGFWSQDSWGGPDRYSFSEPLMEERLNRKVIELNQDKALHGVTRDNKPYVVDYNLDLLMYDLVKLMADEKIFLDAKKEGRTGIIIATDGHHKFAYSFNEKVSVLSNEEILQYFAKDIEDAKKEARFFEETEHTKHQINIYREIKDFVIGEPIDEQQLLKGESLDDKIINSQKEISKDNGKKVCEKEIEM